MMDKYYVFRKLLALVEDGYDVTDAKMRNYFGEIEITGVGEDGSEINIRASMKEGNEDA
jgi:hypothetical protein